MIFVANHIIHRTSGATNTGRFLSRLRHRPNFGKNNANDSVRSFHLLHNDSKRDEFKDHPSGEMGCNRFVNAPNIFMLDRCGYPKKTNLVSLGILSRHPLANTQNMTLRDLSTSFRSTRLKSTVSRGDRGRNEKMMGKDDSEDKNKKEQLQSAARKGAFTIRDLMKKYGWTFIGTYLAVYVGTLASLYAGLDSGLIDPTTLANMEVPWHDHGSEPGGPGTTDREDFNSAVEWAASYMKKFPWTAPYAEAVVNRPRLSNLAIAWVATKLTEPIRLAASVAIVRSLKKK